MKAKMKGVFSNIDNMAKLAMVFCLLGLLTGIAFLTNMTGGTLFLFTVPGTGLILAGMAIFLWALYHDFRQRHSLFDEEVYAPNDIVFKEGDLGDKMYLIREGTVEVFITKDGKENIVRQLKEGEYFGEIALLAEGKRTASIRAITPLKLVSVGRTNFHSLISNLPVVGQEFMKTFRKRKDDLLNNQ